MPDWKVDDRLTHRFNPDLGPGRVVAVEDRTLVVEFPSSGAVLRLASTSDALVPMRVAAGMKARLDDSDEPVVVAEVLPDGSCRLADGRVVSSRALWTDTADESLVDRLARGDVDTVEAFALRLDALHLAAVREADGLGSFLGGRIRLFPHQLHVAERATRADPVRWLLADEVGLGKTVEACLILNHLVRARRAESVLVVAPDTLTVQWLGELWRKYHQVFVLLDDKRLADVERDYGRDFNPFDAHRQVVLSLEMLVDRPDLAKRAVEAEIDLLIVDEAHHLRRPPGHPGNPAYRAVEPIANQGGHLLLLTATPLEDDAHGFFRLLQLLRPEEFPAHTLFDERLERGDPLPPCTSSTRRADIGGLPPRVPSPVEIPDEARWNDLIALENAARALEAPHDAARRVKARRIRRALASGASFEGAVPPDDRQLRGLARRAMASDPRIEWLARESRRFKDAGEKTLVFVAERETLEVLRAELSRRVQLRTGVFHEDLTPGQRDIEVAQFRLESGPSLLVSTECGGEGRNFEFAHRVVLFDLPWNPAAVEQRIGRLDRIGRTMDVEVVYFRPPGGLGAAVASLYEAIGLFREPLGGLDRELRHVASAIEDVALSDVDPIPADIFEGVIAEACAARDRVRAAAYHELHRDRYRAEMAERILARVPDGLDSLTEDVVIAASERLGFHVEPQRGRSRFAIEFGTNALVDHLPGVPGGSSFLGTFDREEAVENETIDFYASGHGLVEGILAGLDESPDGRVALLHLQSSDEEGFGLVAFYRREEGFDAVAVDLEGRKRPDWVALLTRRPLRTRRTRAEVWTRMPGWSATIARLATLLGRDAAPVALAALRIGG